MTIFDSLVIAMALHLGKHALLGRHGTCQTINGLTIRNPFSLKYQGGGAKQFVNSERHRFGYTNAVEGGFDSVGPLWMDFAPPVIPPLVQEL